MAAIRLHHLATWLWYRCVLAVLSAHGRKVYGSVYQRILSSRIYFYVCPHSNILWKRACHLIAVSISHYAQSHLLAAVISPLKPCGSAHVLSRSSRRAEFLKPREWVLGSEQVIHIKLIRIKRQVNLHIQRMLGWFDKPVVWLRFSYACIPFPIFVIHLWVFRFRFILLFFV